MYTYLEKENEKVIGSEEPWEKSRRRVFGIFLEQTREGRLNIKWKEEQRSWEFNQKDPKWFRNEETRKRGRRIKREKTNRSLVRSGCDCWLIVGKRNQDKVEGKEEPVALVIRSRRSKRGRTEGRGRSDVPWERYDVCYNKKKQDNPEELTRRRRRRQ